VSNALRFDYRTRWFAAGRTALALATASELIWTRPAALFTQVGSTTGPYCVAQPKVSIFCLGNPHEFFEVRYWFAVVGLLVVASGYRPRFLGILHLWIVFSVSTSITLPDGGDAIGLIVTLLISAMCIADPRRWQWTPPGQHMARNGRVVAYLTFWALRLQVAYIYADSAIAKMGVADWQNGSAFYYFTRDNLFGSAGPLGRVWLWLSDQSLTTLAITWGTIVTELVIALFTLLGARWRKAAFWLCLSLHVAIFLSMGLFSFSMVMVASASLVATTSERRFSGQQNESRAGRVTIHTDDSSRVISSDQGAGAP
jgi:antimicrobial peptide system SdpB family protein